MIFGGAVLTSQSVFAQVVADDLYFGFQNSGGKGAQDYIINLGPTNGIVGGSSVVNLSSDFTYADYVAVINTTNTPAIYGGVVGGNNAESPSDFYVTQFRTGGAGIPSVPGSSSTMTNQTADVFEDTKAANDIYGLNAPAAGTGLLDGGKSWESDIEPAFVSGSLYGDTSLNPDSLISSNAVVYEDLWYTASSGTGHVGAKHFSYEGYFTISPNGATTLTFTPANTPAPLTSPVAISISYNLSGATVTVVSSNAVPTHLYQLQRTASLSSPISWSAVGSQVTATGITVTNTDPTATPSQSFYRVTGQ
jgi:hypothetical protein